MEISSRRFYVVTGKGGVGKTTLALALTKYFCLNGKKAKYICFENQLGDEAIKKHNVPYEELHLITSVEKYIARKLRSPTLASWIVKAPFFKALLQMVPGFSYLIFLGHILDYELKNNPDLIIVLDSPASGHAITMFEACYNFKDIFQVGILVDDINKMLSYVYESNILRVIVTALPTQMAINEAVELKNHINNLGIKDTLLIVNNCLSKILNLEKEEGQYPDFLKSKIKIEQDVLEKHKTELNSFLPHSTSLEYSQIVEDLVGQMDQLI